MEKPRALAGEYSDLKFIKTRSVVQMHVEFPIEDGAELVKLFGAPLPGKPVRVAIARLNLELVKPEKENGARAGETPHLRTWSDLSPAQQAGIRCNEPAFWKFLNGDGYGDLGDDTDVVQDASKAATYVRLICGVRSRADISKSPAALASWKDLEARYSVWLMDAAPPETSLDASHGVES